MAESPGNDGALYISLRFALQAALQTDLQAALQIASQTALQTALQISCRTASSTEPLRYYLAINLFYFTHVVHSAELSVAPKFAISSTSARLLLLRNILRRRIAHSEHRVPGHIALNIMRIAAEDATRVP